ncbi:MULTISPECIES: dihydrofolate reductase family protein [Pontibacillus]|uniref:Dihydrofolate reductase family protein n=1 Tax=Pontibacillus chungwhensis TaxID=265426 RepID=A0ABY8UST8_9BACI|nr:MULTISPECIES: dihydrofolate reductase family protein [Pontibacillus]MCD5323360.1 dihydrofolate reductase family protein [Pontibacillus sp. HN14]WIF96741.1 dihydrofolate reductase family protein [Pontibacillus chungwhensis]
MSRNVILYIATSLDGYIADKNGDVDWLHQFEGGSDFGYYDFYETIDTTVMGRKTYEHVLELVDEFPYKDKTNYVFSKTQHEGNAHVQLTKESPETFIRELKQQIGKDIWIVGGASLLKEFIAKDLIDEFKIFTMPILLGEGIPLFEAPLEEKKFSLREVKQHDDVVELIYHR